MKELPSGWFMFPTSCNLLSTCLLQLSEDDVIRLGAQQAAMMKMQEESEQRAENESQQLYDAQKEALAMQQQKILQEQQLVRTACLATTNLDFFNQVCFATG